MTIIYWVGGIVTALLFVYLLLDLFHDATVFNCLFHFNFDFNFIPQFWQYYKYNYELLNVNSYLL